MIEVHSILIEENHPLVTSRYFLEVRIIDPSQGVDQNNWPTWDKMFCMHDNDLDTIVLKAENRITELLSAANVADVL